VEIIVTIIYIRESYELGSLATVFQTEVYAILACSAKCRSVKVHNIVYFLLARLRCWLYSHTQFRLNFYTSAGYHCKFSLITTKWDCFGCHVTVTLSVTDNLARMGSHVCGPQRCGPLSASIVRDMNTRWVIDAHSKHRIALNSCRQSKPNTSWVCLKNNSEV
jgi:hypothetical protein